MREYCRTREPRFRTVRQAVYLLAGPLESMHEPYRKLLGISWRARYKGRDGVNEKNALECCDQTLAAIMQGRRSDAGPQ